MTKVALNDHFTFKKILRFVYAPILMQIFISLYSVVDGICVSNLASIDAFAGVNLIFPVTMVIGGIGFMFGAGGAALTSKYLGKKEPKRANQVFTNVFLIAITLGIVLSIAGFFLVEPLAKWLGSLDKSVTEDSKMVEEAINYGRILMLGQAAFITQNFFQSFFIVEEKPTLGFIFTLIAGCTNILFDVIFIGPLKMSAQGAAIATVMGYFVGGLGPIAYFLLKRKGIIFLVTPEINFRYIRRSALNGISDFVNYAAMTATGIVFNAQLLIYSGQEGVEAYGIIMYVILVFWAVFIGYSITMAPVAGYNYGAENYAELKNVLKKSIIIISISSLLMFALGMVLAKPISMIFAAGDSGLIEAGTNAMRIWSISFLFCGFCFYISSFFVGLNNSLASSIISLSRNLVLLLIFVETLPLCIGDDGIWWSAPVTEGITAVMAFAFLFIFRKRYKYFGDNKQ
ncbi:MAG: MATE family efflux transporter [Bacilli bacterium]|nr:MATE family efflux transporter [Bacilli bacterium]